MRAFALAVLLLVYPVLTCAMGFEGVISQITVFHDGEPVVDSVTLEQGENLEISVTSDLLPKGKLEVTFIPIAEGSLGGKFEFYILYKTAPYYKKEEYESGSVWPIDSDEIPPGTYKVHVDYSEPGNRLLWQNLNWRDLECIYSIHCGVVTVVSRTANRPQLGLGELSFRKYQEEIQMTAISSGQLLTRFEDDTGCFEFLDYSTGKFTDAFAFYDPDYTHPKFTVRVKPTCGVCTTPGFYESRVIYSYANQDVQHALPLVVRCDADVVFLTNLKILSTNTEDPPTDVSFDDLKTSLEDWVNQLRSEGTGVWVVDLSDEATTANLGVNVRSGGKPLQKSEVETVRGVVAEAITKTHDLSGNKYVVIGGGVDVIPMPSMDGDAVGFFEYDEDKDPKPQLSDLQGGTPLNDYCYLVNGYTGDSCYSLFKNGPSEYSGDVIISRMLTEKVDYGFWPFGRASVRRRLLNAMLKTATEHREVPQKLTMIGQHCGDYNLDAWTDSHCSFRTADGWLRIKVPTAWDYLSPDTCDTGVGAECNKDSLLDAIGHEGILYIGSHGSGKALISAALYYKTSTTSTTYTLVENPILNDMRKMIGDNLPVFGSQLVMNADTIKDVTFNGGMHVYLGCWSGTPDYVVPSSWIGGEIDQGKVEEATIDNDVAMRALYNGVAALVGCTRMGRGSRVATNMVPDLVETSGTIGEAFNAYKRELGRNSNLRSAYGRYDTICHQLYGDPTIRLVEAS